jgi:hypothetical protein
MHEGTRNHAGKRTAPPQAALEALRSSMRQLENSSRRLLRVAIRELRNSAADAVEGASAAIEQLKHQTATTSHERSVAR